MHTCWENGSPETAGARRSAGPVPSLWLTESEFPVQGPEGAGQAVLLACHPELTTSHRHDATVCPAPASLFR